jgi:phosphatidate cytidylyltransferase
MVADGDDREPRPEDLFEDLDRFFTPIDDLNPVPPPPGPAPATPDRGEEPAPERGPEPAGEGLAPGQREEERPVEEVEGPPEEPAAVAGALEPEAGDRTREMSPREWSRLRDALGEEEEGEEEDFGLGQSPDVPAHEPLFGYEDLGVEDMEPKETPRPVPPTEAPAGRSPWAPQPPEDEGSHELTMEDLKKPPPEYRDLPRSDEKGEGEAAVPPLEEEHPFVTVPEPETPEIEDPFAPRASDVPAATDDEPALADVEAAAEQMAGAYAGSGDEPEAEDDLLADLRRPSTPRTVQVGDPESLTGPSWEEPSSHVVTTEPPPARDRGRNLPAAVLSAAILVLAGLITIAVAKPAFAVVAGLVVLLAQAELYATMQRKGYQPATALGLVMGGLILLAGYLRGEPAMLFMVALSLITTFFWYMAAPPKARAGAIGNIGATMLGIVYIPFLAAFILIILTKFPSGRALVLAILGLTFLYDIAAFGVGTFWGSRALAPTISPKKSWEGLLGATIVTFAFAIAILPSIDPLTLARAVGLALVVAVFAPLGDLAESAIKRDLGVKDMGSILPGHGGMPDRIDSVLFVIPAAFYFLRLIFL